MSDWLRRLRGAIGTGLTWGAAWFAAGMAIMLTSLLLTGSTGADVPYPIGFGAIGFAAGLTFSGVLGLIGRSRRFDQMSLPRFAAWGGAAGVGFSILFVSAVSLLAEGPGFFANLPLLAAVFGTAGAGSASGMLALARAAEDDPLLEDAESAALLAEGDASRLPDS